MKTKQTKINRSAAKWLPGAMALAATTASSQAALVQITLVGNKISSTSAGGNSLDADLTGDLVNDIAFTETKVQANKAQFKAAGFVFSVYASVANGSFYAAPRLKVGGLGTDFTTSASPRSAFHLNPFSFTDSRINGGVLTNGWLEVHAFNESSTRHTVQLTRLIFDDESTTRPAFTSIPDVQPEWGVAAVPEPSGFLATSLLLGAAGLIRRRQARAA